MSERWIVIPNWRKFQREPDRFAWIKDHVDQLDRDEYLELTFALRGLLLDVRKLYARRRGIVRGDAVTLTRALSQRVTERSLQALNDAGLIEFTGTKPVPLARARARSLERERERELEVDISGETSPIFTIPEDLLSDVAPDDVGRFASKLGGADRNTERVLRRLRERLPYGAFEAAYDSLQAKRPVENEAAYFVGTLRKMIADGTYNTEGFSR